MTPEAELNYNNTSGDEMECQLCECEHDHCTHGRQSNNVLQKMMQQCPSGPLTRVIQRTTQCAARDATDSDTTIEIDWVRIGSIDAARQFKTAQNDYINYSTTTTTTQQHDSRRVDVDAQQCITLDEALTQANTIPCTTTHYNTLDVRTL